MSYIDYYNPIHIVWRKGTIDDPYIDRAEYIKVINGSIVLSEIPDSLYKVRINNMQEVNYDKVDSTNLQPNEYMVNYGTGVIRFHKDKEAESFNIVYKGRGFIQYPSDRIYHKDSINNVVESLDNIIENANSKIASVTDNVDKMNKMEQDLDDNLNRLENAIDDSVDKLDLMQVEVDRSKDAVETTKLIFKPYVNTFNQILTTYTNPKVGWTTQVYQTGIRYRYDGISWIPIDLFGGNLQPANHTIDGLMSSTDKIKLDEVSSDVNIRTMMFVFPNEPDDGINHVYIRFPHTGEIIEVTGFCALKGTLVDTIISVQKSSDMVTWVDILNPNLTIKKNTFFNDNLSVIDPSKKNVIKDDIFRIDFKQLDDNIADVTISVKVKIN